MLGWEIEGGAQKQQQRHRNSFLKLYGAIDPATGLPPLPERFLIAEFGDKDKALERWRDTLKFREEEKCDAVLAVPHPEFDVVQRYYPQSWYCRDKQGNVVYIEQVRTRNSEATPFRATLTPALTPPTRQPGGVDLSMIKKNGISVKKLLWHYMYCTEYLWQVTSPSETDRLTTILDLSNVSLFSIAGDVRKFIKMCVHMTSTHYPARGHKLFIINSPSWFGTVWSWVKPMLNPAIDEKLKIGSGGKKQVSDMLEIIDEEELPEMYGGKNKVLFGKAGVDGKLRKHVLDVLEKNGLTMQANLGS